MKQSDIANVIRRDLLRANDAPTIDTTKCFSCGYSMRYRDTRFCSDRCRDWYDAGNPAYQPERKPAAMSIRCAGCSKEFDSKGLRCCSIECERGYRERRDNLAVMAEVGIEPAAKRQCEGPGCNAAIPKWRNGRRVSSAARFCSSKCARKARMAKIA